MYLKKTEEKRSKHLKETTFEINFALSPTHPSKVSVPKISRSVYIEILYVSCMCTQIYALNHRMLGIYYMHVCI